MSNLTILNTSIRKFDNLYSLNDLHVVSGNDPKHRPTYFIKNQQTQDLIAEIDRCENSHIALKVVKGGRNPEIQGTYACEELALAYAMWISPKFHLIVLRAFLAMHKAQPQQLALPEPEPLRKIKITDHEFEALLVVLNKFTPMAQQFAEIVKEQHRQLYDVLALERHVRNPTAAKAHDIAYEFNYWINLARNAINR